MLKALETIATVVTGALALIGLATVVETVKMTHKRRQQKKEARK